MICFVILVPISPLPVTPPPDPPAHQRQPSFKNSNHTASLTSPPLPEKDIVDSVHLDEPCESSPSSPVACETGAVGEAHEGAIKPKRSAPPPPPTGKLFKVVHENSIAQH